MNTIVMLTKNYPGEEAKGVVKRIPGYVDSVKISEGKYFTVLKDEREEFDIDGVQIESADEFLKEAWKDIIRVTAIMVNRKNAIVFERRN